MATIAVQTAHTEKSECPVERTLAVVRDHWSLLILRDLLDQPMRFNDLKKSLEGVSSKVLAERLKEMTGAGIVQRKVLPGAPPGVEYSLTEKGRGFNDVVEAMRAWGNRWMPVEGAA